MNIGLVFEIRSILKKFKHRFGIKSRLLLQTCSVVMYGLSSKRIH